MHLIRSKDDLMDEELFPANYSISKADEEDGDYDSGSECEEDDEEEKQANAAFTAEEKDLDVYEVDDEWGTLVLVTDESNGIFTPILDAIGKRTPKMLHDFAWLAFVCSIRPDIVEDATIATPTTTKPTSGPTTTMHTSVSPTSNPTPASTTTASPTSGPTTPSPTMSSRNVVWTHPYAQPQHIKVCQTPYIYIMWM